LPGEESRDRLYGGRDAPEPRYAQDDRSPHLGVRQRRGTLLGGAEGDGFAQMMRGLEI
jgi:hypothetical protein